MATSAGSRLSLAERVRAPEAVEAPDDQLGLRWRPLGADDADAILDLVARSTAADRPMSAPSPAQVTDALDPARTMVMDSLGGFADGGDDDEAALQAVGVVYMPSGDTDIVRVFLTGTVAPAWRGRGIGSALLRWQVGRARQLLAADDRDLPARIATYVDEQMTERRQLLTDAGFRAKRVFQEMRRPVSAPLPEAPVSAGIRIVNWTRELDDEVRHAHNEAFADHWGSQPMSLESWRRVNREVEPRWSKVALARTSDGTEEVAGYAMTSRHQHSWVQLGFSEGYTELVGVRRAYRGHGIARALLVAVIRTLAEDGIDSAGLDVDTVNPSGAHHFYERLGYEREGARTLYTIEI
ncbi:GNAT family N-acetyltransferase [Georgenia halophila]|uniref:GNAT family N-acetyltransferase n=1 Tax=Georgenia halophila TaxID=620889 RepID=A0ABP8LRJ4_9MICO